MNYKITNGDCLELIKQVPNNSIDMILCDLPYGETGNKWDKNFNLSELCAEYRRVITEQGCIALTGSFRFGVQLFNYLGDLYKYDWVWQKEHGTNVALVNYQPFRVHEYVFIFGKGRVSNGSRIPMKYHPQKTQGKPYSQTSGRISDNWKGGLNNILTENKSGLRHPITVQKFNRDKNKLHPTQKPIALLELLIKSYTDEGDTVLDTCMGSGSTGVACLNTNRRFIGYELDDKYFKIAKNRLETTEYGENEAIAN